MSSPTTEPVQPWQGDHTALVQVLWAARREGLTLDDADELASFIRRSDYQRAVQELAASGRPPVRFAEAAHPSLPGLEDPTRAV